MRPTRESAYPSAREALARIEFAHGARRAFGKPVAETRPGATTYLAREDQVTGTIAFTRYDWEPHAPTWAKPLATECLAAEPRGIEWKPCVVWPFEVVA